MKKFLVATFCLFAVTMASSAKRMPQAIITDCGTVHQIPSGCSDIEAAAWQAYWTVIDC